MEKKKTQFNDLITLFQERIDNNETILSAITAEGYRHVATISPSEIKLEADRFSLGYDVENYITINFNTIKSYEKYASEEEECVVYKLMLTNNINVAFTFVDFS